MVNVQAFYCRLCKQEVTLGFQIVGQDTADSRAPQYRVLSTIAFYEKVIKVKADVAAFLINCFPSA
jgi:hypothetical protein